MVFSTKSSFSNRNLRKPSQNSQLSHQLVQTKSQHLVEALRILYNEVNDLAEAVQKAINPLKEKYDGDELRSRQVFF
ncbi:hypothetical protein EAY40_29495 [Vibrio anguillarum]|nr:hypothetical protein [Vibrio anguillarum]